MANLAIKGHRIQGDKVIKLLEILGGKNNHHYLGINDSWVYYINKEGCITRDFDVSKFSVFTLEEFIEKFPYKIGDKVRIPDYESEVIVNKMKWDGFEIVYGFYTDKQEWCTSRDLIDWNGNPCEEEAMGKEISGAIVNRFICLEGYDFYDDKGNFIDTKEIIMKKKQPKYPKTYEECCNILNLPHCGLTIDVPLHYSPTIICLTKLLICRDVYWKIAGDWEPKYKEGVDNNYYTIHTFNNKITLSGTSHRNAILSFPTEETRDAFYENFKELIEECKELL